MKKPEKSKSQDQRPRTVRELSAKDLERVRGGIMKTKHDTAKTAGRKR